MTVASPAGSSGRPDAHRSADNRSVDSRSAQGRSTDSRPNGSRPPAKAFLSIGEVLSQLRPDFPDVTISKIRFLESEGLVDPERTSSGYRKFSRDHVARLRFVLTAQRDDYLPLRVIKERLDALDRGLEPGDLPGAAARMPRSLVSVDELPHPDSFAPELSEIRLSRAELLQATGLEEPQLKDLEQHQLITSRTPGGHYDGTAVAVGKAAAEMARFGIEPRHLRNFRSAADREIGLVQQVITPLVRQRNPDARARAEEVTRELAALSVRLHAALVKSGLRSTLNR